MSEARTVFRHTAVYALGAVLNRGAAFVVVPLFMWYLPESEYGVLGVVSITAEIVGAILGLNLATAMSRIYFDYADARDRAEVVTSAILGFVALTLAAAGVVWPLRELGARALLGSEGTGHLLFMGVMALLLNVLYSLGLQFLAVRQQSKSVVLVSTLRAVLYLGTTAALVAGLEWGVFGALAGLMLSNALAAGGLVLYLLVQLGPRFDRAKFHAMVRFGMPLVPGQLAYLGGSFIDRYLLSALASLSAVGVFFLGLRFSSLLQMVFQAPFNQIYLVRRMEAHGSGADDGEASRVFTQFFLAFVAAALALALFAPDVIGLFARNHPEYVQAAAIVPLLAIAEVIQSIVVVEELGILYAKKSHRLTVVNVGGLLVQAPLNWWLIPVLGITGAAIGVCLSGAFRLLATWWLARGLHGPRPQWTSLAVIVVAAALAFAAGKGVGEVTGRGVGFAVRLAIVMAFPVAVLWTPLFAATERRQLRQLALGLMSRRGLMSTPADDRE